MGKIPTVNASKALRCMQLDKNKAINSLQFKFGYSLHLSFHAHMSFIYSLRTPGPPNEKILEKYLKYHFLLS